MFSDLPHKVEALLKEQEAAPPVDMKAIADGLGLPVYSANLPEGVSGMLRREETSGYSSGFVCYVEKNESSFRQRFTAAHEIGHMMLHADKIGKTLKDNYMLHAKGLSNKEEKEANDFADNLLMPWHLMEKYVLQTAPITIEELSDIFEVSPIAMARRLGVPA